MSKYSIVHVKVGSIMLTLLSPPLVGIAVINYGYPHIIPPRNLLASYPFNLTLVDLRYVQKVPLKLFKTNTKCNQRDKNFRVMTAVPIAMYLLNILEIKSCENSFF